MQITDIFFRQRRKKQAEKLVDIVLGVVSNELDKEKRLWGMIGIPVPSDEMILTAKIHFSMCVLAITLGQECHPHFRLAIDKALEMLLPDSGHRVQIILQQYEVAWVQPKVPPAWQVEFFCAPPESVGMVLMGALDCRGHNLLYASILGMYVTN